ncbi:MAG: hypothetical protein HYZ81_14425 [Nitrospinae bacterium]|nr:hypothetical protein [Nitrospinota bacterium]
MTFYEVVAQVLELLQREGRVSYRALKLQFTLDDDYLEGLKEELIEAKRVAVDEGGRVLAWVGPPAAVPPRGRAAGTAPERLEDTPASLTPIAYTPRHLAERILAEQATLEAQGAPDGERKTITALFADIKGSMVLLEDLHWLDRETEAWLNQLSERVATVRLLLLVNYRPEYRHAWGSKTYYTQLRLDSLGPEEAQELLTALVGDDGGERSGASLRDLKQVILAKTEGNPFFIEEIVQTLMEQGVLVRERGGGATLASSPLNRPLTAIQLPPTVQAVLTARIDRLPAEEKALLQTLAVVGKTFAWGLLARVMAQLEEELLGRLAHLRAAEFIELLALIYGWFTEGFDTADLREAKASLEELV